METSPPNRMLINAFSMNCVSHIQHGMWVRDDTRQVDYTDLGTWVELAQILERGCFDALFLADVTGVYDNFRGGPETALREAMQIPVNDPTLLIPTMAHATKHLGFAYTGSILAEHPFIFARRGSTLDHLTKGRVAWNIVTSYLPSAAHNLGFDELPGHDARYDLGDEYLDVLYKLWEASWDDDAVVRDTERGVYTEPDRVHMIDHHGPHYDVPGPHLCEPSPQRTPLLFQAGMSDRGREFAARHAEGVFIAASRKGAAKVVADVRQRAVAYGRNPDDLKFFLAVSPIVGGTEAEAIAKRESLKETLSIDGGLVHMSGNIGADLGEIDPHQPLSTFDTERVQGVVQNMLAAESDKSLTFADVIARQMSGQWLTGTPEQIADVLESLTAVGVDGFNIVYTTTPGTFVDFIDGVVPELQRRGVMQTEYAPGTLREKLFGHPRLPDNHPAAAFRR